jgi:hypothetical protein
MSDNYLRLVPSDPFWLPSPEAVNASLSVLRGFVPVAEGVSVESKNHVSFFDAGGNGSRTTCPSCGTDLQEWWGDAVNQAWMSDFDDLSVITPCCRASTSLNDLVYDWPAAFGRFALVITNPGVTSLASEQLRAVELALGSPLKVIWQRI